MAIGQVKASGGLQAQLVSDQSSEITARATAGLGDAVNRLAMTTLSYMNSKTEIEAIYDRRASVSEGLDITARFAEYQTERGKEFAEYSRGRSSSPMGMTREYDEQLAAREEAFLATVPDRHKDEWRAKLAQDRAQRVGSAFTAELTLMDEADTNTLNQGLNTLGSALKGKQTSLEDAQLEWAELVEKSGLPAETKEQFILNGNSTLQGLEFGTIVEETAKGYGAVNDGSSGDVAAAGLAPQERGVLNGIAAGESPGYNVWNGGSTFEGYEDHPAATGSAPGESTAAGKYQFTLGTWRAASASYERTYGVKVPDFSPEWQDRVALHWAEKRFNELNGEGLSFKAVLASGDPQQILKIKKVLGNPRGGDKNAVEWQGLGDGYMSDAIFLEVVTGQRGIAGGGTGAPTAPNVWTDPRFANLSLESKLNFSNQATAAADSFKKDQATILSQERKAFMDQAYNAGFTGNPAAVDELKSSQYWDAEAQAKFNEGMEVYRKSESGVAGVSAALSSGTPLAASQSKAFGDWFGQENFAGIASGDAEAYKRMGWAVEQARMFPEGSVDAFRAAMANPNTAPGALEFLASAYAGDSSILKRSGFTQDDIAAVNLFRRIAERSGSAETAYANYEKASSAENRTGRTDTQLSNEAVKLFSETYPTVDEVVDTFDGWLTSRPDITLNENTGNQLLQDAQTAFQDGYKIYGTSEGAEAYMQSYLDDTWGVTQTRTMYFSDAATGPMVMKSVLMKHPPEKYYSDENGDGSTLYKALAEFALVGGVKQTDAVLIPDDQTEAEVRSGKLPTYRVLGKGEFGEAILLPNRFGGDALRQDIDEGIEERALKTNSNAAIDRLGREWQDVDAKIKASEATGKDPESIAALRAEQDKLAKGLKGAITASLENNHLSADMPTDITDPKLDEIAKTFSETMLYDPTVMRRLDNMTVKVQGDKTQARRDALAKIIQEDYGTTNSVAKILADKMLENY